MLRPEMGKQYFIKAVNVLEIFGGGNSLPTEFAVGKTILKY